MSMKSTAIYSTLHFQHKYDLHLIQCSVGKQPKKKLNTFHVGHYMYVISKVLHTALARPVWWWNRSDFRNSCEPDFIKEYCVHIGRLRGPCSAKRSLEIEEESDWSQISCSDQRSYINLLTPNVNRTANL